MPRSRNNGRHRADDGDAHQDCQQKEAGNEDRTKLPGAGKRLIGRATRPDQPREGKSQQKKTVVPKVGGENRWSGAAQGNLHEETHEKNGVQDGKALK